MRIVGIGTDIVEIGRIQSALNRYGTRFARRILHPAEMHRYETHSQPASYLAKRFAAKEAVAKALGTGIGSHTRLAEIETRNDEHGKPMLQFHGKTSEFIRQQCIRDSFISLSDERDYAIAYVILTAPDTC